MRTTWACLVLAVAACSPTTPEGGGDEDGGGGPPPADGGGVPPQCDPTMSEACVGSDVYTCEDGVLGDLVTSCGAAGCQDGKCLGGGPGDCDEATQVIYAVDKDYNLLAFDPRQDAHTFALIGQLDCPAGAAYPVPGFPPEATPFSMSIDRTGRAWVLYTSGEIFLVSTEDASCQASGYVKGSEGFQLFGMGFVSDAAGADAETLFIAGGSAAAAGGLPGGVVNLGAIVPATYAATKLGQFKRGELTGNGNAELWGYFPALFSTGTVENLDKVTGASLRSFTLPPVAGLIDAFAFAHWGGRFYVFITAGTSQVLRLDPAGNGGAGTVVTVVASSPYEIVGAGVSTCAPVVVE